MTDLPSETVSLHEHVDLPEVKPLITHHRRLSLCCSTCGTRVVAPVPEAARGTPFGPRLHAVATYLKTFQALSYERLQSALSDLFGLTLSQGGLMNLLRRAQGDGIGIYSGDRFNFVSVRGDREAHTWKVSDAELMRHGRVAFHGPAGEHVLF